MQAQSPQAPYVGIWTRTAGFRRSSLERLVRSRAVVRATLIRQTLHLVTVRDYAMMRAALAETTHYDKTPIAVRVAPAIRKLAGAGSMTTADALAYLERHHGLKGVAARRAFRGGRVRAH